ncbi:nuclear transport factor 2 family protein [Petrimonas sp.]|uniref:nuclear transport factor 2 family protein n=1 Tax=Petrimonas sp. TaxID=2023866 RepID=UPI003F50F1D9
MKKIIMLAALLNIAFVAQSQTKSVEKRIVEIEDRLALKELVDRFSILSDIKHAQAQALLFTEDAVVETYQGDKLTVTLQGREQIAEVFGNFLNSMETVYHINGQQTVELNGNNATGISYCLVTLIGMENGKKMITNHGVFYQDNYVKDRDRKWLISKRKSTFHWTEKREFTQQ